MYEGTAGDCEKLELLTCVHVCVVCVGECVCVKKREMGEHTHTDRVETGKKQPCTRMIYERRRWFGDCV